jgi:tetratricopeptide (TPR) repeat protein
MITLMIHFMRRKSETGRSGRRGCWPAIFCTLGLLWAAALPFAAPAGAQFPERPSLDITGYVINAELEPSTHHLSATAAVTFNAPANLDVVTFGFHPALKITKITDQSGKLLDGERTADGSVRVTTNAPFVAGQPCTWTFTYEGILTGEENGPVEGMKLAQIQEPISYLLYAARWFPMTGYMTDRFSGEMHIRVPQGMRVFASGAQGTPQDVTLSNGKPGEEWSFNWPKPDFPGTVIAGRYVGPLSVGTGNVKVYLTVEHQAQGNQMAQTANDEYNFFTNDFGMPETSNLDVVEIPDGTLSSVWAPELAGIPSAYIGNKSGPRLLANTMSHQWWGCEVSPATLNDAWITNGMARYSDLLYLEDQSGASAMNTALEDVEASALAYDTIPLSSMARLDPFSPQFQSMTLDKGGMVFHMLQGVIGDKAFLATLKGALSQYSGKSITTDEFEKVAEEQSQQQLLPFFSQWVNGTGAPQFTDKYAVYRLGNNKGFRTIGEVDQDLDLFNMPVQLRIETDGQTVLRKVDVVGDETHYVIDTFGRPREIKVDPDDWVLKDTPDLKVRIAILKGQYLVAQGDLVGALAQYQNALKINPQSSLANYRIGEVLFTQHNFQASVNAFRDALRGDDEPAWTEVWSHIEIGKIFDITGQRDRAVNEYRLAIQTNDNTQGALNEAREYLQKPYKQANGE